MSASRRASGCSRKLANNQCLGNEHSDALRQRDIVYAPDFVINAGGLINVAAEREPGGYNEARVLAKVQNIARTLCRVLDTAQRWDISTQHAALQLAERKLAQQRLSPTAYPAGPYPLQRADAS